MLYNYQNKPERVNKADGSYVKYVYDGAGRKLRQEVYNAANALQKSTDYVGELLLENEAVQLVQTEEGRIVTPSAVAEYQYHLTDHQGNVRMTFTTKDEVETTTATVENVNGAAEQGQYVNYNRIRRVNSRIFDKTYNGIAPPAGTSYAVRLSGVANEKVGLARSLAVVPGDRIDVEVFAKYVDVNDASTTLALRDFVASIVAGTAVGGTVVDGSGYSTNSTNTYPYTNLLNKTGDTGTGPRAYLNYLVFNKDFVLDLTKSGFRRITSNAMENGQTVSGANPDGKAHEQILRTINITEAGYVYLYLSNEETTPIDVYFDDFKVVHTKSPVVQSNDNFSHGMENTSLSYQRENSTKNNFLYNAGSEVQSNINQNIYDMPFRGMDVSIGRMMQVDPMADSYASLSTYNYAFNDPVFWNDPSGAEPPGKSASASADRVFDEMNRLAAQSMGVRGDDDMYGSMFGRIGPGNPYGRAVYVEGYGYVFPRMKGDRMGLMLSRYSIDYSTEDKNAEDEGGSLATISKSPDLWVSLSHFKAMVNPISQAVRRGHENFVSHPFGAGLMAFLTGGPMLGAGGSLLSSVGGKALISAGSRLGTQALTNLTTTGLRSAAINAGIQTLIKGPRNVDIADVGISALGGNAWMTVGVISGLIDVTYNGRVQTAFSKGLYQTTIDVGTGVFFGGANFAGSKHWAKVPSNSLGGMAIDATTQLYGEIFNWTLSQKPR